MYCKALLATLCLVALSCSRPTTAAGPQRIAFLRFENLSGDVSADWMGRAFSEVITNELSSVPGTYTLPAARLHRPDQVFGRHPVSAPGISAERTLALAAGATQIAYGSYWFRAGKLEARVTIEDPQTQKMIRSITASAPKSDVLRAATEIAHAADGRAARYLTQNTEALRSFTLAVEDADVNRRVQELEQAIAADRSFLLPYDELAQIKLRQGDRAGSLDVLKTALAAPGSLGGERGRLAWMLANLSGDHRGAQQSLIEWARSSPNDPEVWNSLALEAMNSHQYPQAQQAYEKALEAQPDDVNLLNQLGYAAAYAGHLDVARKSLERYQSLRPADPNPLDSLGDVHFLLGRFREAEGFYLQAAKKDPAFLNGGDFFKAAMARLMTGDVSGADSFEKQFSQNRQAANDRLVDFQKAEWAWMSGRRKGAVDQLNGFARDAATGPLREIASQAYSQLAIWNVCLGNRSAAAANAEDALRLAGQGSMELATVARFLAQPAGSSGEWFARVQKAFPDPAQKRAKDLALIYALFGDKHYQAAAQVLRPIYDQTSPTTDNTLPLLLAWAELYNGRNKEAAALLAFNPLPPSTGIAPFSPFYFPRLFFLRGKIAQLAASPSQARTEFQLFRQLSGPQPLAWGEEDQAK